MRVRVASLFSGVGGLDLGVERGLYAAGVQADTVFQCEADEFGRSVLRRHWPAAEVCDDVRSINQLPSCELLIGGFPCQGISTAGKGRGLEDERSGLFFEIIRLLRVAGSAIPYVLLENTPAINSRGLDRVLWELAGLGYNARWGIISAGSLGYGHQRRRWFLCAWLADSGSIKLRRERNSREVGSQGGLSTFNQSTDRRVVGCRSQAIGARSIVSGLGDFADGVPSWVARCHRPVAAPGRPQFSYEPPRTKQRERGDRQRLKALGNAVVPGQAAAVAYWLGLLMRGVV